jgi:uncharacterized SAM-binding protein YcdF (DUF218 family)
LSSTSTRRPAGTRRTAGRAPRPRRGRRLSWRARIIFGCAVVVIAIVGWAALARAMAPRENTSQKQFDVLIVLGNPADDDGNPTAIEQARVSEAVSEYERGVAPRMIFTGGAVRNQFVEAQVMARTAEAQGIPASAILEESQARNTIENACDSLRIMRSHGWDSAEVVTSPRHLPRAAMIFSRLPIKFRMRAAPPASPEPNWLSGDTTAMEILKTVHYLVWSRQSEPCEVQ